MLRKVATKPAIGLVEPLRKSQPPGLPVVQVIGCLRLLLSCGSLKLEHAGEKDIRTYVQKKREVFLVHMACDNKREEIAGP